MSIIIPQCMKLIFPRHTHIIYTSTFKGRKLLYKSERAQASNTRANNHLGGLGAAPLGKFGIFNSQRVFLRPYDSSFEASFSSVRHTERYSTHLKTKEAQLPLPPFLRL